MTALHSILICCVLAQRRHVAAEMQGALGVFAVGPVDLEGLPLPLIRPEQTISAVMPPGFLTTLTSWQELVKCPARWPRTSRPSPA